MKVETLKDDADWLFDKLKHNHVPEIWNKLVARNTEGNKLPRKYFSQVRQENIRRLYMKYQVDFEMFEYENQVQKYIDMGYL